MNGESGENVNIPAEKIVPFEQSLQLARKLYAEFEPAIRKNLYTEMEGVKEVRDYPNLIKHFLQTIPDSEQERYAGHGITKTSGVIEAPEIGQLAAFLNILSSGKIRGSWAPLARSGYVDAYKTGPFLILSHIDQNLVQGQLQSIGAAVVNAEFYPMVEKLRELFPDINIIRAGELPDYFKKEREKTR